MATVAEPQAELCHLPRTDGSATFASGGFTVSAAVNGPIEAPRRDENAHEALVDVVVRPAAGVGGIAERRLEAILQSALRQLIPIRDFPRCMIQVTLQVLETSEDRYAISKPLSAQVNLVVIPALLHAAILGLLTAAIPLKMVAAAVALACESTSQTANVIVDPSMEQVQKAQSIHVLGYTSHNELLLGESSGSFSEEQWSHILDLGERLCCRDDDGRDDIMSGAEIESRSVKKFFRSIMETKTTADLYWK